MGSIDRRIFELEKLLAETAEPVGPRPEMSAILNEFSALKASCAHGFRGGVPITPENIPLKILGPGYTTADVARLAVERASTAGAFPEEDIPRWTAVALELFNRRADLDEVVAWERAPHGA